MPTIAGAALAGSALDTAGNIFGMIQQDKRNAKQFEQQKQLMDIQMQNQMKLNEMGSKSQLQMWKDTNYTAQIDELKKAGLNPSLVYGMKGGGGVTTGSQGGGSASSGAAPQAPPFINIADKLNLAKVMSEVELIKSQKENVDADTTNKQRDTTSKDIDIEIANDTKEDAKNIIRSDRAIRANEALESEINAIFDYYILGGEGNLLRNDGTQARILKEEVENSEKYKTYKANREKAQAEGIISKAEAELTEKLRSYGANNMTVNAIITLLRTALGK